MVCRIKGFMKSTLVYMLLIWKGFNQNVASVSMFHHVKILFCNNRAMDTVAFNTILDIVDARYPEIRKRPDGLP